jgi:hypothetical protein
MGDLSDLTWFELHVFQTGIDEITALVTEGLLSF